MKDLSILTKSKSMFYAMDDSEQIKYMQKVCDSGLTMLDLSNSLCVSYEAFAKMINRKFGKSHPFVKKKSFMQNYYFKMDKVEYKSFMKACEKQGCETKEAIRQVIREYTKKYG